MVRRIQANEKAEEYEPDEDLESEEAVEGYDDGEQDLKTINNKSIQTQMNAMRKEAVAPRVETRGRPRKEIVTPENQQPSEQKDKVQIVEREINLEFLNQKKEQNYNHLTK